MPHTLYSLLEGSMPARSSDICDFLGSAALGSPSPSQAYFSVTSLTPCRALQTVPRRLPPSALDAGGVGGGVLC